MTTPFDRLGDIVYELAEAQKQAAEGSLRIESAVVQLIEAQTATFKILGTIMRGQREDRKQIGGLATAIGFGLEDAALKALPALLQRDLGVRVHGRLTRTWVNDKEGNSVQVNIFGKASKGDKEVVIVGESKSQLSKNDVYKFKKNRLDGFEGVFEEVIPILVTHMTNSAGVERYVKELGIALYYSYDF